MTVFIFLWFPLYKYLHVFNLQDWDVEKVSGLCCSCLSGLLLFKDAFKVQFSYFSRFDLDLFDVLLVREQTEFSFAVFSNWVFPPVDLFSRYFYLYIAFSCVCSTSTCVCWFFMWLLFQPWTFWQEGTVNETYITVRSSQVLDVSMKPLGTENEWMYLVRNPREKTPTIKKCLISEPVIVPVDDLSIPTTHSGCWWCKIIKKFLPW